MNPVSSNFYIKLLCYHAEFLPRHPELDSGSLAQIPGQARDDEKDNVQDDDIIKSS